MTMSTAMLLDPVHDGVVGSDDVTRPRRRRFGADYKRAILEEYDGLTDPGAKGALLRSDHEPLKHLLGKDNDVRQGLQLIRPYIQATSGGKVSKPRPWMRLCTVLIVGKDDHQNILRQCLSCIVYGGTARGFVSDGPPLANREAAFLMKYDASAILKVDELTH